MLREFVFQFILWFANTVQTITGFAGNLLAMPFSIRVVGMQDAKTVINLFSMFGCLVVAVQGRRLIRWRILGKILLCMIVGMSAGVCLAELVPEGQLLLIYAVLVILIAVKKLYWKRDFDLPEWFMVCVLFVAGIIHGMFLSGGALLVVYALSVLPHKDEFRATVATVWIVLDGILAVVYGFQGHYTVLNIERIGVSMLALVLSALAGNYLYHRMNQEMFQTLTYVLILISGLSLLL